MNSPPSPSKPETAPEVEAPTEEQLLDESLHETFPASDPISPGGSTSVAADTADGAPPPEPGEVVDVSPPATPDEPLFPTTERHPGLADPGR